MPSSRKRSRAIIDKVLRWTKTGLTWGQNINSVIPIPSYAPISQVLLALINRIGAARSNEEAAAAVLTNIQTFADIIGSSREELVSRITPLSTADQEALHSRVADKPSFQDPFEEFLKDLRKLETLSEGLEHRWYLLRIVFSSDDAEIIQKIRDGILDATKFFETRCHIETQAYLRGINDRVEEIHAAVKREADDRVLESLPHADAGYRASINAVKGGFLEGTRSMLFVELEKWINGGFSEKPVCILSGGAGTGKSTVASELARRLDNQGKLGASFFFARGVTDLDSTWLLFPTIAYQLSRWANDTLRQPIVDAAQKHLTQGKTQAMKYEAPALLHDPLEFADKDTPIFVVVDALDECTQDTFNQVPEMLDLLMAATNHGPIRIFLTSRPDQLVEYKLQSSKWANIIHTINIDDFSDGAGRDIAALIEVRFREIAQGPELLCSRPEVADRLAARAQGLFIYARTAIAFLETYSGTLEAGVNLLLSGEEGIALGALDQLYLTVLVNAFPPAHLKSLGLRTHVQLILACIALLSNPTTPRILESLTALTRVPITCQDTESVMNRLRSVVVFKPGAPDEVFLPMHATFPQFLLDRTRCTNELYLVDPRRHHAYLAEACLRTVLSLDESMCKLDLPALPDLPSASETPISSRTGRPKKRITRLFFDIIMGRPRHRRFVKELKLMLFPGDQPEHVRYACMSWAAHLREACTPERHQGKDSDSECFCGNLAELLQRLSLDSDNLKRLQIINLMEETGCTLEADLDYALNWLPSDGKYNTVRSQLQDAAECIIRDTLLGLHDARITIGEDFPDHIYRVVSLVRIGTSPL